MVLSLLFSKLRDVHKRCQVRQFSPAFPVPASFLKLAFAILPSLPLVFSRSLSKIERAFGPLQGSEPFLVKPRQRIWN
jgi:hypothetical protein